MDSTFLARRRQHDSTQPLVVSFLQSGPSGMSHNRLVAALSQDALTCFSDSSETCIAGIAWTAAWCIARGVAAPRNLLLQY
jgi:hypothetical protein